MCHADGVGELDLHAVSEPCRDDVLRHVARRIRRTAVYLCGILTRECTAAVTRPAAVGIDDDLAPREPRVAVRSADDELARRIDEVLRLCAQEFCRDDLLDDLLDHVLADRCEINGLVVLGRDDDRIDIDGLTVLIGNGDLRLAVGTQIREHPVLAHLGQAACQLVSEHGRERHILGRLVRRIAEHHALIACADRLCRVHIALTRLNRAVNALCNIRRLFIERDEDAASVGVKAIAGVRIADLAHGLTDDLRDIDIARGRDLTDDVRLSRRDERLTGNTAHRILCKDRVEDAVRDLVGEFVRMSFGDGLGRKEHFLHVEPPLIRNSLSISHKKSLPLRCGRL